MLSDEQIVLLLSRDGTREDMLREAWRMGMMRAAEVCDVTPPSPFRPSIEAAHAIRAEAGVTDTLPKAPQS